MSFPAYESYRDSGHEWLGHIPAHWELWKLSHAFLVIGSGTTPKSDDTSFYDEGDIPWLNTGDLNDGEVSGTSRLINAKALGAHSTLKVYQPGAVVIAMYGATIGKLGILRVQTTVNQACCVFDGAVAIKPEFLFYWLQGFRKQIISLASGGGQPNINQEILRALRAACPETDEQDAISAFLDRETAKIDDLVAEQLRLIELLKEKRQAVISHAVTKGLDPAAPMKDSGVEWLGDVPAHWRIVPLKRTALIRYGIGEPPKYQDEGVPLIRATNVDAGHIRPEGLVYVDPADIPESRILWLREGDIIVVRSGAYTADSAIVRSEHLPSIAGFDMVLRPHACASEFVQFALLSWYLKNRQLDVEKLRAAQPHLNAEELGASLLLVPPASEQELIAEALSNETSKLDLLLCEATLAIRLLQERRAALISAAVTGKIDVRGLVSAKTEAA